MKILLLVDWTFPCDHQFLKTVYAEKFVERGHDVTWVMRPTDPKQKKILQTTWNGSEVYVLPDNAFDPLRSVGLYITGQIDRHELFETGIQFQEYDLIHVRNDLSLGLCAAKISDRTEVPFVHQISHLKSEKLIESAKKGFEGNQSYLKGYAGKRVRGHIADSADLILPISETMREYLYSHGYHTPMKVLPTGANVPEKIPNGNEFLKSYGVRDSQNLIYIGSMSPYRNLEFLFDVLNKIDIPNVQLLMVGGRSEDARNRLIGEAEKKGVKDRVVFTGWINKRDKINRAIAGADIGLSPLPPNSILRMNAPIKTLEYLSLKTPVVASNTPDQDRVLTSSGGGIATDYNVQAFSTAVQRILSDKSTQRRMGECGRAYIRQNRNFTELAGRSERIYETLVNRI